MLDFAQFTTQDWIAAGSLAVSTPMLVSNIVIAVVSAVRTNRKIADIDARWKRDWPKPDRSLQPGKHPRPLTR